MTGGSQCHLCPPQSLLGTLHLGSQNPGHSLSPALPPHTTSCSRNCEALTLGSFSMSSSATGHASWQEGDVVALAPGVDQHNFHTAALPHLQQGTSSCLL